MIYNEHFNEHKKSESAEKQKDCINEEILKQSKREYSDSLAQYVKRGSLKEEQVSTVRDLLKKKDPELVKKLKWQTLATLITDSNQGVRRIIAYSLRFNADPEKAGLLLMKSLESEKDWIVREEIINSLGEIGAKFEKGSQTREEIELSITKFLSDKRHVIRIAALKAVAKLKIKEAKDQLNSMCLLDPVLPVRAKASQVLQELEKE